MPRAPLSIAWIIAVTLISTPTTASADEHESHPFTAHDLVTMDRVSDPQVSPDGQRVAFVVRAADLDANKGRTDLWLLELDRPEPRRLTTHPESDSSPRWVPDGSGLYFLSGRSGSQQVWYLPLDRAGEARPITELPVGVGNLVVAADGDRLAFTAEVFPEAKTLQETADRLEERENDKTTGQLYDRVFVRHWDTWKDGRRSQLFTLALDASGAEKPEPVNVSGALDADVPSKPFGGAEEITFTPDGEGLVFTARISGTDEPWSTNFDLYHAPADGSKTPEKLTENPAWDTHPVFSPDGKTLAYLAMERPGYESDRLRLVLRSWPGGEERILTRDWDRSVADFAFSPDGTTIYATAGHLGQRALFALDTQNGEARELVTQGTVRSPRAAGDRVIFGLDHLRSPVELYAVPASGGETQQLTSINAPRLAKARMGKSEQFTFEGAHGEEVYAYLVKPVDFDPEKSYPLAFLIHGGPQGSFGNNFHYRWNPQTYAGAGYAAVMVDFHGSTGYGQAFTDSIRGDWGGAPLEDLQKGLAAALERYPWIDGDRACALGASYGGYMVNWIAGNWPDGFRCLVNHDGLFDMRSMYYSTEELWFPEWDFRGTPWQSELYEKWNPAAHVEKWQTPMLVIHGALDYRVPDTQGLATFNALQRRGVPSQLLFFPDENHWVLKPHNSLQWHGTVNAWLDRWLGEGGGEAPEEAGDH